MPAGRPREFDLDQALDQALQVFWRKGFDGASLPDLTRAMGINRPSLYAAFGNKEALFRKAIERYVAGSAAHVCAALQEPTARAAVERLLHGNIDLITAGARGCFLVQGAQACGAAADPLRREMARRRSAVEAALRARFEQAIVDGDLPASIAAADLARFVATISYGLAVQAAGGATRAELHRVADLALRAWPK